MNEEYFEFKVGDRVCIEGVLIETGVSGYPVGLEKNGRLLMCFTKHGQWYHCTDDEPILKLIERQKPKLIFEFIKNNLVPMKHLLIDDEDGYGRLYLGFNRDGNLVTDDHHGSRCIGWDESDIKDWTYEEYNETKD